MAKPNTSFIGRHQEVGDVCAQLRQKRDVRRLITVTGPGGVGKTRLAWQVKDRLSHHFPDGSAFVPLASVRDRESMISAIALGLEIGATASRSQDELIAFLRSKTFLLILDNFEHVLDERLLVSELVNACPGIKVLVTSRTRLRINAEREFHLAPMELPDPRHLPSVDELLEHDAVELFVSRVQAFHGYFALTSENARFVVEICRQVDGLPLAIELAAAKIRYMDLEELLRRLEHRLPQLTGGPEDQPTRLQTMRDAIAWSYDLLAEPEQSLFRRLAVFVGGWSMSPVLGDDAPEAQAAEGGTLRNLLKLPAPHTVCNAAGSLGVAAWDGVTFLVDNSLVQVGRTYRYLMLETIREFGRELLANDDGEMLATCRAHAAYFTALSMEAETGVRGPRRTQEEWLDRLEGEHGNFGEALEWVLAHNEVEMALELSGLRWFWEVRGHWDEGRRWLERIVSASASAPRALRAKALSGVGAIARYQGDFVRSLSAHGEALELYRAGDTKLDLLNASQALNSLGLVSIHTGDYDAAEAFLKEGLGIRQQLYSTYERSRPSKDDEEYRYFRLSKRGQGYSHFHLGKLAFHRGEPEKAKAAFKEAINWFGDNDVDDTRGLALVLLDLATVEHVNGNDPQAALWYGESLDLFATIVEELGRSWCLDGVGELAVAHHRPELAAMLFGKAVALRGETSTAPPHLPRPQHEEMVVAARVVMGNDEFERAWQGGKDAAVVAVAAEASTFIEGLAAN